MKGSKEAKLVESELDEDGIARMEYECPHCGDWVKINERLDPSVVAVSVDPCEEVGSHRWKAVPAKGDKRKTA